MRTSDDVPSGPGFGLHAVPIWRPWHERLKRLFAQQQHVTSRQERDALNSHFAETLIEEAREVSEVLTEQPCKQFRAEQARRERGAAQRIGSFGRGHDVRHGPRAAECATGPQSAGLRLRAPR